MRLTWLAAVLTLLAATALAAPKGPPKVDIEQPEGGWSTTRIVELKGSIDDSELARAVMVVNGFERWIDLRGGRFQATLVVSAGANSIEVVAKNALGEGRDAIHFVSDVPPVDLQVVLTWDTDGTDVDLHVTDPSGEECFYGHRDTQLGGKLDVDDTDGFGPEVFTLANAKSGEHRVEVKYYSSNDHPQTALKVQVVMYEGTEREKRVAFQKILTKTGDKELVGLFTLEAPEEESQTAAGGK
jgi:uncharacterized protein YfaP (DUF2135 family)